MYSIFSLNPFDFSGNNDLHYRILTPLIAYFTGLNGPRIIYVQHFFLLAILVAVFVHYRKQAFSSSESFYMAALIAFSGVLFVPFISPGYTDSTSFFLVFMAWISTRKPLLTAVFVLLALFNHEANVFIVPALMLKMLYKSRFRKIALIIFPIFISIGIYWLFRQYISQFTESAYTYEFYLGKANLMRNFRGIYLLIPIGMFFAFKLFWFYPLHAIYLSLKKMDWFPAAIIFTVIAGVFLQYFIAYDITRLMILAFPAILMGAEILRKEQGSIRFRKLVIVLIVYNFLVLQYFVSDSAVHPIYFDPLKL